MSSYVTRLNEEVRRAAEDVARQRDRQADDARERLKPLGDRLARLLATMPRDIQRQGVSLAVLQTSLRGRRGSKCHAGELAAVLRKQGFVRRRQWRGQAGFRALWFPT